MNNFLIGMFGGFDEAKFQRDFRKGFFGIEACMFPGIQEARLLADKAREGGFGFGVHYPFIKKDTLYRDPFLLALDKVEREKSLEDFEREAVLAAELGASYILAHFPKPVLVNRSMDIQYWRFIAKEWMFADEYPSEALEANLGEMFAGLSRVSERHNIQVVIENDAMPEVLSESSLLPDLLEKYDMVKVCLDIARLHLQEIIDPSFHAMEFTEKLAPFTYLIHLWNTNPTQNQAGGHYPVLPRLSPSDGWADIVGFLKIIKRYNPDVKVLFEHRSDLVSDKELEECYQWVRTLLHS